MDPYQVSDSLTVIPVTTPAEDRRAALTLTRIAQARNDIPGLLPVLQALGLAAGGEPRPARQNALGVRDRNTARVRHPRNRAGAE